MIDVVAAIIENDCGKILIAKRKKGKILEGYWEFPGGKIDEGESAEVSLERELKEEMNIKIEVKEYIGESLYSYERGPIRLLAFKCEIIEGTIILVDHEAYKWVNIKELSSFKLAPADIPILNYLR